MEKNCQASAVIQVANTIREGRCAIAGMSQMKLAILLECHTSYIAQLESIKPRKVGYYPLPSLSFTKRMEFALELPDGSLWELVLQAKRERTQIRIASKLSRSLKMDPSGEQTFEYAEADAETLAATAAIMPLLIRVMFYAEGRQKIEQVLRWYRTESKLP